MSCLNALSITKCASRTARASSLRAPVRSSRISLSSPSRAVTAVRAVPLRFRAILLKHRLVTVALLKASGDQGLDAFLPPSDRVATGPRAPSENDDVPHLPLTPTWEDGKFALRDVLPGGGQETNVRQWTLRLLQRYRFVIGETPSHFAMLTGPSTFRGLLSHLQKNPGVSLLCVNDDVAIDDHRVSELFWDWATRRRTCSRQLGHVAGASSSGKKMRVLQEGQDFAWFC